MTKNNKYVLNLMYADGRHRSIVFDTYKEAVEYINRRFELDFIKWYDINEVEV